MGVERETSNETCAGRFRSVRKMFNLRQQGLADKLGVTVGSVVRWERGDHPPNTEALLKLLELEPRLDIEWLLTGRGEMFKVEVPEVKKAECVNCHWWMGPFGVAVDGDRVRGECRASNPVVSSSVPTVSLVDYASWPMTQETDWCGKYKERPDDH
ncbi:MAG: helix-turn-helix transcriptional regulator [Dehalococcoidales bacterium]